MRKACIYARVSTEGQKVSSQVRELREFCQEKGFKIVKEIKDEGYSGATLDRPGIEELRNSASEGLFEAVVFHTEDRVARDEEAIDAVLFERDLKKSGVEVIYMNSSDDPLTRGFKRLIAAYERKLILKRTRRGRFDRVKRGAVMGGNVPFGYKYKKETKNELKWGEYVVDEEQAKVVSLIFDLYLQLGSPRKVIRELTKRNITPPKGGGVWRKSSIGKILRNETYIGTTYWNKSYAVSVEPRRGNRNKKRKRINNGFRLRPKEEWIAIKVPVILSKEKFNRVQKLITQKRRPIYEKSRYLLSGLVICGKCSSTYSGESDENRKYYRCNNRHRTFPNPPTCNAKMIRANELEKAVWEEVRQALENPEILMKLILDLTKDTTKDTELLNEEKQELLKAKEEIKEKRKKLLELYAEDKRTKEAVLGNLEGYSEKETAIDKQLKNIELRLAQLAQKPTFIKNLKHFCNLNKAQLKTFGFQRKKEFLNLVLKKVVYFSDENRVEVIGHIPIMKEGTKAISPTMPISELLGTKAIAF